MVSGIEWKENDVISGGVNSPLHQQVNTKVNGPHCTVQTHTQKNNRNKASTTIQANQQAHLSQTSVYRKKLPWKQNVDAYEKQNEI